MPDSEIALKRIDQKARARLARLRRRRGAKRRAQRLRALRRRAENWRRTPPRAELRAEAGHGPESSARLQRVTVKAPRKISLASNYDDLMDFFAIVRRVAFRDERPVLIDLRDCMDISPETALLLTAEFHRIRYHRGSGSVTGISPRADEPRRILHNLGFFDALDLVDPLQMPDDLNRFQISTGVSLDGTSLDAVSDNFAHALGLTGEQRLRVQTALFEALENASEHAYFDPDKLTYPAELGRWWVCAVTFPDTRKAYLLAADLGMSIPTSLPESVKRKGADRVAALAAKMQSKAAQTEDERLLCAAFDDGVTRRADGRGGRGLGKMAALADEFNTGFLSVWSGNASAWVNKGATEIRSAPLSRRFHGTYVFWHLGMETAQ